MILGNKAIIDACESGEIIITPFITQNLQTSSYDVTLGDWTARYSEDDRKAFNDPWSLKQDTYQKGITLYPGECVLGHTNEFIGGRNNITTMLKARSTIWRHFISICSCAGWWDVGYINRWTLELKNNSNNPIHLDHGMRIGQIVFMRVEGVDSDYTDKWQYQIEKDIEEIINSWKPDQMIPKTDLYQIPKR